MTPQANWRSSLTKLQLPAAWVMLTLSVLFFALGVSFPIMRTGYQILGFGLKNTEVNIFDSVALFYDSGDWFIATVILLFTFVLPTVKYVELFARLITRRFATSQLNIDKWNMIDVFLVALLLLNFKMNSSFVVMELEIGTVYIALAVITRIFAVMLIKQPENSK